MLEKFSECQFQGVVHRTRSERNDSMSQMEGWKKIPTTHIYIHTYKVDIYITYGSLYIPMQISIAV